MLSKFIFLDQALDNHPPQDYPCLPDDIKHRFIRECWDVLAVMKYVHNYYVDNFVLIPGTANTKPLLNLTIKCNSLTQIAQAAETMNPRLSICYSGED